MEGQGREGVNGRRQMGAESNSASKVLKIHVATGKCMAHAAALSRVFVGA